jgi:hypothetical protein
LASSDHVFGGNPALQETYLYLPFAIFCKNARVPCERSPHIPPGTSLERQPLHSLGGHLRRWQDHQWRSEARRQRELVR